MKISMPEFTVPKLPLMDQFHHPYLKQVNASKVRRILEAPQGRVTFPMLVDKQLGDVVSSVKHKGFYYIPMQSSQDAWLRVTAPEQMMNTGHRVQWAQRYIELDVPETSIGRSLRALENIMQGSLQVYEDYLSSPPRSQ